jgi:putative thioredoxin
MDNGHVSMSNPASQVPLRGAVDLAAVAAAREAQAAAEARLAQGAVPPPVALVVDVDEASFQTEVVDRSFQVPVVIDLWAEWCQPCKALSPILDKLVQQDAGRWLLAKVDVDANPRIAQAFQVQSIPSIIAVVKGQPVPLFQGALPEAEIRAFLDELLQVAEANGVTGRLEVDGVAAPEAAEELEPEIHPGFDAAYDAIEAGDWDAADTAYRAVLAADPADPDAAAGLAQVALLRRTDGADPGVALASAAAEPDSLAAQALAADFDLLSGDADAAFARMIALVRRTSGDDRTAARDHLVTLFALVGDADPRVLKARSALASALF